MSPSLNLVITSSSQSVRQAIYTSEMVCVKIPPIIPIHIPYQVIKSNDV